MISLKQVFEVGNPGEGDRSGLPTPQEFFLMGVPKEKPGVAAREIEVLAGIREPRKQTRRLKGTHCRPDRLSR